MRISGALLTALLAVFTASILISSPLVAQQSAADCAEIKNDRQRLECFDRFYSDAAKEDASEPDTSSITEPRPAETDTDRVNRRTTDGARREDDREDGRGDREAERARREAERARSEAEQARREAAQARREAEQLRLEIEQESRERDRRPEPAPEPESETPEERFGMEKKMLELGGDEMSSTALGQFDFWEKGQRIELENGQVWEITNSTNLYYKAGNPQVTIEKGLFSSFYMHIDGVSKALKVERIR